MRYPSNAGRTLTLLAVLALVGVALMGCPEPPEDDTPLVPPAEVNGVEPVDVGEEVDDAEDDILTNDNIIEVTLTEYEIDMLEAVYAGAKTFEVTNEGEVLHNFVVDGHNTEKMFEEPLEPGETGRLDVDLQPGTYRVYCPIGDHAEEGMEMMVNVITME